MGLNRLKVIEKLNSNNPDYKNKDLYRLLYTRELYVVAYEKIKSNKGANTPATEEETLQGYSLERIDKIISKMKNQSWQPKPARLVMIPKPGKKTLRPLGIQGPDDKVVQEIVRMILHAIYDKQFDQHSYGFRPSLGCHNALKTIYENFDGLTYAIEGDIQSFFPTVNHSTLISILNRKITDQKFLDLIYKMLKAGYWTQNTGKIEKPDTGTPQGSIVSPMLSNIYLNELDKWIRKWTEQNIRKEGTLLRPSRFGEKRLLKQGTGEEIRRYKLSRLKLDAYDDTLRKERLFYVRYADDFIIGLFTPPETAERLKKELTGFLHDELKLTLSQEKTKITDMRREPAIFLGHEIYISSSVKIKLMRPLGRTPFHKRTTGKFVKVEIPIKRVIEKLHIKGMCDKNGYPISKGKLTVYDDADIIEHYNSVLNGYLNFYSGTTKTNPKYRIYYILKFSCAKTLAHKHKSSMAKILKELGPNLKIEKEIKFRRNSTHKKTRTVTLTPNKTFKQPKFLLGKQLKDPSSIMIGKFTRSKLFATCLICGSPDRIEMHHLNSLKNIKPRTFAQLHGYVRRKQIPLCAPHHRDVTHGKYNGIPLRELLARTQLTYNPDNIPEEDD